MEKRKIKRLIEQIVPSMIELRRDVHANPEPGFQEFETAGKILQKLEAIPRIHIRKNVAETGIVATLGRDKSGPCVALRADMDCLPIEEETGKTYASKRPGYMHACGHDGHTACLVGSALVLAQSRDELEGPVKFIFQPSEERDAGAQQMCREGALEDPPVDAIFGLHCHTGKRLPLGEIALCRGAAMAGSGDFKITVHGKGGHAAHPHTCIDPIYVGTQIVNALQSIVPKSTDPFTRSVVTVAKFHAGTATNIIPNQAVMEGTFRALSAEVLKNTAERIKELSKQTATAYGADVTVTIEEGYPVLINHEKSTAIFENISRNVLGEKRVKTNHLPLMGSEDFAYYTERIPGTFWFLGTRPPGVMDYPLNHHAKFDFNDDALAIGMEMHCEVALRFASLWDT